jgi:hypothetical protein
MFLEGDTMHYKYSTYFDDLMLSLVWKIVILKDFLSESIKSWQFVTVLTASCSAIATLTQIAGRK